MFASIYKGSSRILHHMERETRSRLVRNFDMPESGLELEEIMRIRMMQGKQAFVEIFKYRRH